MPIIGSGNWRYDFHRDWAKPPVLAPQPAAGDIIGPVLASTMRGGSRPT